MGLKTKWGISLAITTQTPFGLNGHVYVWHMQLLSPWGMMEIDEWEDEESTWTNQTETQPSFFLIFENQF